MNGMKWQGRRNEYLGASGMEKAVLQDFRPVFQMPGIIMTRLISVRRTYFTSAYIGQAPGETGLKPDGNPVFSILEKEFSS